MFAKLKEFINREIEYRKALRTAEHKQRLASVSEEAKIKNDLRLAKAKAQVKSVKTGKKPNKLNTKLSKGLESSAGFDIMNSEF